MGTARRGINPLLDLCLGMWGAGWITYSTPMRAAVEVFQDVAGRLPVEPDIGRGHRYRIELQLARIRGRRCLEV